MNAILVRCLFAGLLPGTLAGCRSMAPGPKPEKTCADCYSGSCKMHVVGTPTEPDPGTIPSQSPFAPYSAKRGGGN